MQIVQIQIYDGNALYVMFSDKSWIRFSSKLPLSNLSNLLSELHTFDYEQQGRTTQIPIKQIGSYHNFPISLIIISNPTTR